MKKSIWSNLLLIVLIVIAIYNVKGQCSINESVAMLDLNSVSSNLLVDGAVNNDLTSNQSVCGVSLEFEHQQIGDLTIELTSPAGQTVTLVGPTKSTGLTTFTDWEILFVTCGDTPSPDSGFTNKWNNDQSWGILGDYTGSYHPYLGCLEDFNTGSANGIWNIEIIDNVKYDFGELKNASIFFCNTDGILCNVCDADAGVFSVEEMNVCLNGSDDVQIEHSFPNGLPPAEYSFYYVIRQDQDILFITEDVDLSTLASGTYQVCGLSIHEDDEEQISSLAELSYDDLEQEVDGNNPSVCAELDNDCVELLLSNAPILVDLDVTICDGDTYEIGGDFFSAAGEYEVVVPQSNGCDSIYNLDLSLTNLEAVITSSTLMLDCSDPELVLDGSFSQISNKSDYLWQTSGGGIIGNIDESTVTINQPGMYTLSIIEGLCVSTTNIQILANDDAPELTLTAGSTITCANPLVMIDLETESSLSSISWEGPFGYTSTDEDVLISVPGVYTVTVESDNGCKSTKSILINQAGDAPFVELTANNITCFSPQVLIFVNASSNNLTYSWTGPSGFTFNGKNPVVSEAGTYQVVVTDPFGCFGFYSIEISGNSSELEYELEVGEIICVGGSADLNLDIDSDAIVTWTYPNGSTQVGINITTIFPGNYSVSILLNGCTAEEDFVVGQDLSELPVAEPFQEAIIDCANPTAFLNANITSNLENVDHVEWWLDGSKISNDFIAEVYITGQYVLFVYSTEGCEQRFNISLAFDVEVPTASISTENYTCKNVITELHAFSSDVLSYNWGGPGGYVSTDSLIKDIAPGAYFLTITDEDGCERVYKRNVNVDTIPKPLILTAGILNCINDSVTVSPTFTAVTNALWSSTSAFVIEGISIKVGDPGIYFMEAEGVVNGCISFDTIEVIKDISVPDLTVEDQTFNCGQGSLLLMVSSETPNVSYSWTGPSGFASSNQSPLVTDGGLYEVTVTGLNGCTTSAGINVSNDNVLPNVGASFDHDLDCENTQSDIIGTSSTSDVSILWTGPNNFLSGLPVVTIQVPGDYTFIVTGTNGCSDSVTINVPFSGEFPEFSAVGDTLFCGEIDKIIDVFSITPGVDYTWTGPNGYISTDEMNTVVDSGMYILIGEASNSCITMDTAFVVFDDQPAVVSLESEVDTLDCVLTIQDIILTTDKDFTSISWTGPNSFESSSKDIEVMDGGLYEFTGVSANNCEVVFSIDVFQDIELPDFSILAEEINCDNTKADIALDIEDSGATYVWSGPSFSSDLQNPVVEDEGMYLVTVTGSNGCTNTDEIEVFEDLEKPDLVAENDTLPCDGSPVILFAYTETVDAIINWIGPSGFDSVGANPTAVIPGTYFIEVVGPNGCSTNESIELLDVPVFPEFDIEKLNDIDCNFESVVITAIDVIDDKEFTWTGPDDFVSTETSFETNMEGMYYIAVTGETGCISVDSVLVTIDTIYPDLEINQIGRLICEINEVSISGDGSSVGINFDYNWSTTDGVITFGENSLNPVIGGAGTYKLIITNESNGCTLFEEILVEEEKSTLESVDWSSVTQTCSDINDGEIILGSVVGGVAPFVYAIEGTAFSQVNVFKNLESGEHLVSVKDSFGCVLDTLIDLEGKKAIKVDLGNDLDIHLGETVDLVALTDFPTNQIDSISWHPVDIIDCDYCLDYSFMPAENMIATIFITDKDGCTTSDQIIIRVDEAENIYIPNIFTPNNDGNNDIFIISKSKNVDIINYFNVYDRWGDKVFSDENFIPGFGLTWDGRHNGTNVLTGVYFYIAEIEMVNGKKKMIKGNITLIR